MMSSGCLAEIHVAFFCLYTPYESIVSLEFHNSKISFIHPKLDSKYIALGSKTCMLCLWFIVKQILSVYLHINKPKIHGKGIKKLSSLISLLKSNKAIIYLQVKHHVCVCRIGYLIVSMSQVFCRRGIFGFLLPDQWQPFAPSARVCSIRGVSSREHHQWALTLKTAWLRRAVKLLCKGHPSLDKRGHSLWKQIQKKGNFCAHVQLSVRVWEESDHKSTNKTKKRCCKISPLFQ